MTGARSIHDELERLGWEVAIGDAQRVKGLAPLACKTDKIDASVLAELSCLGCAGDLAADPRGACRSRAGALAAPPDPSPHGAHGPDSRHLADLRESVPGL